MQLDHSVVEWCSGVPGSEDREAGRKRELGGIARLKSHVFGHWHCNSMQDIDSLVVKVSIEMQDNGSKYCG